MTGTAQPIFQMKLGFSFKWFKLAMACHIAGTVLLGIGMFYSSMGAFTAGAGPFYYGGMRIMWVWCPPVMLLIKQHQQTNPLWVILWPVLIGLIVGLITGTISKRRRLERVVSARHCDGLIHVRLESGLEFSFPCAAYPRLAAATPAARANIELSPFRGLRWPDLDEFHSIRSLLRKHGQSAVKRSS